MQRTIAWITYPVIFSLLALAPVLFNTEVNMKFMILVKSNPDLEARIDAISASEMKAMMAEMEVFNDELRKAGVMKDCDGLRPSRDGKRVRFDGKSRALVDGPFTGDLVAGYWIWELPSIEAAVEWVKRCPNPMTTPSEIEIRPIDR
jgi:hypothetical protein